MPFLVVGMIAALTVVSVSLFGSLHRFLHPGVRFTEISGAAIALMIYPSALGVLAPALMLLNLCFYWIPPLRRIFERNSRGVPGASLDRAMTGLRKMALVVGPPSFLLALIGAIEPWARQ